MFENFLKTNLRVGNSKMTIIFQNIIVFWDFLHFCTVFKTWKVCTPNSTFYQIFDCISLKVQEAWKFSQIHANPHASCSKKIFKKCLSIFLVKWNCIFFNVKFWYKLTQPNVQYVHFVHSTVYGLPLYVRVTSN